MTPTDAELVGAWKGGDAEAFAKLAARYERRIAAYLAGWEPDPGAREDLIQEVCLRIYAARDRLDPATPFGFHALHVARNLAIDRGRRAKVARRAVGELGRRLPGGGKDPGDALLEQEKTLRLRREVQGLPEAQREALTLKIWGGLNWSEVGRLLGCSEDKAGRLGAQALAALAGKLGDLAPEGVG